MVGCSFLPAQEKGMATYYSKSMHGRRMSDGTRYNKDSLTCAHRRYPLGTMLKVTNIKNGKSVVVKVTDRCGSRIMIDLSYAAAKKIDMLAAGITMVKVEKYRPLMSVPFKPTDYTELPEFDFEVTEKGDDFTPIWMKTGDKKKAMHEIKTHNHTHPNRQHGHRK